jgi:hypothetical protein
LETVWKKDETAKTSGGVHAFKFTGNCQRTKTSKSKRRFTGAPPQEKSAAFRRLSTTIAIQQVVPSKTASLRREIVGGFFCCCRCCCAAAAAVCTFGVPPRARVAILDRFAAQRGVHHARSTELDARVSPLRLA